MKTSRTQELYVHAKTRIPGGTQLLSKRPEQMAPDIWPAYFKKAFGCQITDLDDRTYYDFSISSAGASILGYSDPDVNAAVMKVIADGNISTLNPPEEVALANRLCEIHPWASQVRLTRAGGESLAAAVRIARATTDRSKVVISGYHGWHDWYLAANLGNSENLCGMLLPGLSPYGVPRELRGTTTPCQHGDFEAMEEIFRKDGNQLAAIVAEPCRHHLPTPGFLEFLREKCSFYGIILIFDEVSIGWRWHFGGSHLKLGVTPDMAVFSKALGNGHPIGAIIGTKQAMEGAHKSFISSTYWTERTGPAAALATLDKLEKYHVAEHVNETGRKIMGCWRETAEKHGIKIRLTSDFGCLSTFAFDYPEADKIRTLYTQIMLEKNILTGCAFYPTLAHDQAAVTAFAGALDEAFQELAGCIANDRVESSLRGPVAHSGFQRLIK